MTAVGGQCETQRDMYKIRRKIGVNFPGTRDGPEHDLYLCTVSRSVSVREVPRV